MQASINSIESCGTVDGPGIRTVIFFNKCLLRCKYCHNPECFNMQGLNYTCDDLIEKIKRYKPYYGETGGVTLSGGEPLLQAEFVISFIKKLKKDNKNSYEKNYVRKKKLCSSLACPMQCGFQSEKYPRRFWCREKQSARISVI